MESVPALVQQSSSVAQSMHNEFGKITLLPRKNSCRSVPSSFAHSSFGSSLFQSDQNNFLQTHFQNINTPNEFNEKCFLS